MAITHISGMDRTGKSTICNKMSEQLNCNVIHFDKPQNLLDGKKQYFDFLKGININQDIICDRYHDGEHIYAPLYRGYESNYLKQFEVELRKYPYLFVNTTASIETIIDRIKKDGEDFVKEEHYQTILDLFKKYIQKQSMPYIIINTDDSLLDEYIGKIMNALEKANKLFEYCIKNNIPIVYYGNIFAKYIVVTNDVFSEDIKKKLIEKNIYEDCWITTDIDEEFIKYQKDILSINEIITL